MNKETFIKELKELNIILTDEELEKFETYKDLLKEYNQKFNLTSIINDEDIYLKHFYDSLCLLKIKEIHNATNLLDIGTGAGFPGIPLAIIKKDIKVTLVESNGKKCNFLSIIKENLKLDNIEIINSRAEDYTKSHKETFDIATSRAVAHLSILAELEIPALKVNGYFIPLKSKLEEELKESQAKLDNLNATIDEIIEYKLPIENSNRTLVKIRKLKQTKDLYPREYNKIKKEIEIKRK